MNKDIDVPRGYMQDAHGNFVHIKNVRKIDIARDKLVHELWKKASQIDKELKEFKRYALLRIAELVAESAQEYDVRLGGRKGNVTLTSYDGSVRILRSITERIAFSEQLEVARNLVHECIQEYAKGARRELKALVDSAFEIDNKGHVSVTRVLGLRRVKIEDDKWKKAMDIIADSIQVVSSKEYIRFYCRNNSGDYELINMNFAG